MAESVRIENLHTGRIRSLVWPPEHGAWGMLLVALANGAIVGFLRGSQSRAVALFLTASVALFCLRTPVEALLGTSPQRPQSQIERHVAYWAVSGYLAIALTCLLALFWNGGNQALCWLGAAAAFSFGLQALLRKFGRGTRMVSQIVGSIGLTSTAAGAYYVCTGRLDTAAYMIWAANWIFAANQIQLVQLRIHAAKVEGFRARVSSGWKFLLSEGITVALLLLFFHFRVLPKMSIVAFHPMLLRGAAWFFKKPQPLKVHHLGLTELGFAIIFGVMFVAGFWR